MKLELNIAKNSDWLSQKTPIIISGPCSVESEEQVLQTAKEISKLDKVSILRGGIWKPRTRPNSFEGIGAEGLKWLKQAGKEVGLPVATEVANAEHVEACLKNDIDILWIGARTTVNPFSVQEIADALKGVDIPVFVKNPITPDINLWIGALERINAAGITKLAALHRGFSSFDKSSYRNSPMWEIPIELKLMCPELPLFCDPSHIAGDKELIPYVAQKAMDLGMEGLMIESHINPAVAKSDAKQQLTPHELGDLLAQLIIREKHSESEEFINKLEQLRSVIDELDEELINKFSSRMSIIEKIGKYKHENNVTILQLERWEQILKNRSFLADKVGLSDDFIKKMLELVHQESIRVQTKVMNKSN
ncbi:MAG: bifunctional 3-deoxy-7-phosphoheptulonate synthase/chorismate mutase type II [Flavobacteriales bacterium]|nr:bifunctional 3-deoxy-7-phosphoheptulonate synthase/chorismate mutase type II [Flavobacteriales bacterium]